MVLPDWNWDEAWTVDADPRIRPLTYGSMCVTVTCSCPDPTHWDWIRHHADRLSQSYLAARKAIRVAP